MVKAESLFIALCYDLNHARGEFRYEKSRAAAVRWCRRNISEQRYQAYLICDNFSQIEKILTGNRGNEPGLRLAASRFWRFWQGRKVAP